MVQSTVGARLLTIAGVRKSLGNKVILDNITAGVNDLIRSDCKQAQIVGLLGPSGVGKTTLFRILAGLDEPDAGDILIGKEQKPVRRGMVGVVAQNYPLFAHRTVLGNLRVAQDHGHSDKSLSHDSREAAQKILKVFGLESVQHQYPSQLSGGQRQRVAIAQQFMCSDDLVLMDEPFSGLDVVAEAKLLEFLRATSRVYEEKTYIIVTHDISAALQICDTIWVMGREWPGLTEKPGPGSKAYPGARIMKTYDLVAEGLAWEEDPSSMPQYGRLRKEIAGLFPSL